MRAVPGRPIGVLGRRLRAARARPRRAAALGALGIGALALLPVLLTPGSGTQASPTATAPTATTQIKRQDLVEVESEDGELGHGDSRAVVTRLSGTITWLPDEGAVVKPDGRLYDVDGSPVILMDGSVPAYRELSASVSDGPDVAQLERNLRKLGYDEDKAIELDDSWDTGTTAAVVRWQEAHGLVPTGAIELGRVTFQPSKRRIESINVTLGGDAAGTGGGTSGTSSDGSSQSGSSGSAASGAGSERAASGQVMTTASTRPVVTVDLDTSKESLARVGAKVSVDLPSGDTVRGTIASVGKVATSQSSESEGSDQASSATEDATVEVTIRLGRRIKALDQAPATVNFEQSRRRDVLAVPVTALLARAGGAYAVEVRDGRGRRLVPVTPGLYAGGYVEIEGEGLRPGMTVTDARV